MEDSFLKSYLRQRREKRSSAEAPTPSTSPKKPGATVASGNVFGQVQVQKQKPDDSKLNQEVAPAVTPDQSAKEESKIESVRGQIRDSMLRSSIKESSNAVIGAIHVLGVKIDGSIQKMTIKVVRELGKINVGGGGSGFGLPDFNGPDGKGKGGGKWGNRLKTLGKGLLGVVAGGGLAYGASKLLGASEETSEAVGVVGGVAGGVLSSSETARNGVVNAGKWVAQNPGKAGAVAAGGYAAYQGYQNASTVLDSEADTVDRAKAATHLAVSGAGAVIGGSLFGAQGAAYGAAMGDAAVSAADYVGTALNDAIAGTKIGDAVQTAVGTVFDTVAAPFSEEARARLSSTFSDASAFIGETATSVSGFTSNAYNAVVDTSTEVFGIVKDVASGAAEYSANIFAEYKDKAAGYLDSAGEVFTSAATLSMGMIEKGGSYLKGVGSGLIEGMPTSENLSAYFKEVVQQGSNIQARATDMALAGISSIVVPISDAATVIGQSVSSFKNLYTSVVGNFEAVTSELSKTADTIKDGASDAARAVWQGVRAGAQRVAQGASEGAQNAPKGANVVEDTVNKVVGGVTGAAKAAPAAGAEVAKGASVATKKGSEVFGEIVASGAVSKGLGVGRFTEDEQKSIKEAQANGERFRGGQGLTQETKDKITAAAEKHGIDPKHLMTMAQMESGGNPNAVSSTGASGLFQFTGGTGKQYGITNRFDQDQNIDAAARLYKDNAASLKKQGIEPTLDNVYLAHQQGAGGAGQIIRASEGKGQVSETVARNMGLNVGGNESSAQGFRDVNAKHIAAAAKKAEAVTVADSTYNKKASGPSVAEPAGTPGSTKVADKTKPVAETKVAGTVTPAVDAKTTPVAEVKSKDAPKPAETKVAGTVTPAVAAKTTPATEVKPVDAPKPSETKVAGTVTPAVAAKTTPAVADKAKTEVADAKVAGEKPQPVAQQVYPQMFAKPTATAKAEGKALDTSKVVATQGEVGKAPAAMSETVAQAGSGGMPTAKARSVEFERIKDPTPVSQVEISNFPEQEPQQTSMVSGGHAGAIGRSAPFIDEIPLMVSDMGLVLLQTGHI